MCNFHPLEVVGRGSEAQLHLGFTFKLFDLAVCYYPKLSLSFDYKFTTNPNLYYGNKRTLIEDQC